MGACGEEKSKREKNPKEGEMRYYFHQPETDKDKRKKKKKIKKK